MPGVEELLNQAALGRIGVDRRLIQKILDQPDAAAGILTFSRAPRNGHRLNLDPLIVDLFRYLKSDEALDFYIDALRRDPEDVSDDLIEAFLPFGERAVPPLLALYEELGEEQGSDIAFLLAGLRVRNPKVLELLLDRLEYDAGDGAFLLGLYGDKAARPALEKMLAEIPDEDVELRREIERAIEALDAPEPKYQPESFDILKEYPRLELPAFDLLPENERLEMFASPEWEIRAGAARSFFNEDLNKSARDALFELAKSDPETLVRAQAWESLSGAAEQESIQRALIASLNDESKPVEERAGAAVGLYAFADKDEVRRGIEALYELGGHARVKALEAMWRSLWDPYAKYFTPHLDDKDPKLVRQALRGAGYFRLTKEAEKIASYFDRDDDEPDLREDALFAYALAMPGETTRGRVRGMLRKVDSIAGGLTEGESELVMFALDERLRLHGLAPVFASENEEDVEEEAEPAAPAPSQKVGRNDPCPCGSGKKYKKCHGA